MNRIMVTCAGSQKKWNNHLGVPSHLVKDRNGERILERTLRQLRERGYTADQILVFHPPVAGYYYEGAAHVVMPPGTHETEYHTTQDWWLAGADRNVLLLGDTWFTDEALDTILSFDGEGIMFFGRYGPSSLTGSPWGELFSYSWLGSNNDTLTRSMRELSAMRKQGKVWRFCGWELLYFLQNQKVQRNRRFDHRVDPRFFTEIDDATDDVDFPVDAHKNPMFGTGKR